MAAWSLDTVMEKQRQVTARQWFNYVFPDLETISQGETVGVQGEGGFALIPLRRTAGRCNMEQARKLK